MKKGNIYYYQNTFLIIDKRMISESVKEKNIGF